jgi:hypothetical protein
LSHKIIKYLFGFGLYHMLTLSLLAQGELSEQPRIFYRNEESIGILLNSNGYGISGRYGKRINARKKTNYEFDLLFIKHPKEVKNPFNNYYNNNKSFVYGKLNSFFNIRAGYGRQKEIFRKVDRGGISIRRFYSFGPSLGILKPVYYEVIQNSSANPYLEQKKFDPSINYSYIWSRASFFKGINEISVVPGAFGKAGISFEYSRHDITLHALETGIVLDIFPKEIPIMATEKNNFIFFSFFVSYRFGKVVDASGIIDENDLIN